MQSLSLQLTEEMPTTRLCNRLFRNMAPSSWPPQRLAASIALPGSCPTLHWYWESCSSPSWCECGETARCLLPLVCPLLSPDLNSTAFAPRHVRRPTCDSPGLRSYHCRRTALCLQRPQRTDCGTGKNPRCFSA